MSTDPQNKLLQTINYSVVSKYSCVKGGYQRDALLETFIENWLKVKSWKRSPLINRGYAARMMSIDWIVSRSIKFEGVDCFIILGAGYDFLPFRHSNSSHCAWIELDLPEVVSIKSEFIQSEKVLGDNEELIQVTEGIFSSTSSRYHLVECDLTSSNMLASCLEQVFSAIGSTKNVAIINEVCLCNIDVDENRRILSTVIETVRNLALRVYYIGYEQYKPHEKSPFNDVMSEHFSVMSYPLKHLPTSKQLRQLFLNDLNFNHLTITPVHQIYHTALAEDRETDFKTAYQDQPFDEYEELSLYLSHYALVTGVLILKDPFIDLTTRSGSDSREIELADGLSEMTLSGTEGTINFVSSDIERYGHSSCAIETEDGSYSIFISGGFGKSPGKKNIPHKRLNDCVVVKPNSGRDGHMKSIGTENIDPNLVRLDRMYGQVVYSRGANRLFFNGGRQSPNKEDPIRNAAFTARLIDDNELDIIHSFQQSNELVRWRHKLCAHNSPNQFLQVGGLSASIYADPIILWNLDADKLGAFVIRCTDGNLFRRHSFAMDARDEATILLMGGLQACSDLAKDRPIEMDSNTILWDTRQAKPQTMNYDCANSYGSSIHFVDDYRLVKIGGISSKTGLAENTVQLLDLRTTKHTPVAEDTIPLTDLRIILSNTGVSHSKGAREIITSGGGGNYFTFGTHFNRSHLVYRYT